jgi:hypothetical protein
MLRYFQVRGFRRCWFPVRLQRDDNDPCIFYYGLVLCVANDLVFDHAIKGGIQCNDMWSSAERGAKHLLCKAKIEWFTGHRVQSAEIERL